MLENNYFLKEDEDGITLKDSVKPWVSITGSKKLIFLRPVGTSEIKYACSVPDINKGDQMLLQIKYPTYSDEEGLWVTLIEYENEEERKKILGNIVNMCKLLNERVEV